MALLFASLSFGQNLPSPKTKSNSSNRCSTMEGLKQRMQTDPQYAKFRNDAMNMPKVAARQIGCDGNNTITIPVAFHFDASYTCANEACLLDEVQDQLDVLNASYGDNTPQIADPDSPYNDCPAVYGNGADVSTGTCINFCMAVPRASSGLDPAVDPPLTVGQFEGGTSFCMAFPESCTSPTAGGAGAAWAGILNIFIVGPASGNLGIADGIPGAANGDGVTVGGPYFGGGNDGGCISGGSLDTNPTFNLGITLVHEVGHYLGLYHTFQGGCGGAPPNPGPTNVNDTPLQADQFFGCPTACVASGCGGGNQATANYMNYSDDACLSMYTEDQATIQNYWANQLFAPSPSTATCSALTYTMLNTTCLCPTTVTTAYTGADVLCEIQGTFLLPDTYTGVAIDFENAATYTWSSGGYLPGGTALTGPTYTIPAPSTCAPEDFLLYLNISCSSDPTVQLDAGTHTLTVSPDPTRFAITDLVTFTDGNCNGPTYLVTTGCESYVTVTQNGGPTFPETPESSGAVNYDVVLDYNTACLPIELVGTIGTTTLNGSNDAAGDGGGVTCVNGTNPTVDEVMFTIPAATNATDVNLSGVGSILEVCIDLTVTNSDVIIISLDSPNCASAPFEDLWFGAAFNGGSNTGSTNICFTPDIPNGDFDGAFDGDDGNGTFDNCQINGNSWIMYIANYGCYLEVSADGTLNSASITFNDGQQVDAPVSFTTMANYNCSTAADCPVSTTPTETADICDGGTPTLPDAAILAGLNNSALSTGSVAWYSDAAKIALYSNTPIAHTGTDNCLTETVTLYAEVTCLDDNSKIAAGQLDLTVYPSYDASLLTVVNGDCSTTPSLASSCGNYTITPSGSNIGAPPTPGVSGNNSYDIVWGACISETVLVPYACATMAMILDPCACLDNESAANAGDGQLSEVVQIESVGPGETWYIMAVAENGGANAGGGLYDPASAPPPAAPTNFTIGAAGEMMVNGLSDGLDNDGDTMVDEADEDVYYTLQGIHVDGLGYEITMTDGAMTLSINNTCYYPDINSTISASYCDNVADFDLTPLVSGLLGSSGAATTGTFAFEVLDSGSASVSTGNILSPGTLGAGTYTIVITFDEVDAAVGAVDPGCITTINAALTITACGCPANNGTLSNN